MSDSNIAGNSEFGLPTIPGFPAIPNIPSIPGWSSSKDFSAGSSSKTSESDLAKGAEEALKSTENHEMMKWALVVIGAFTMLRALASAFFTVLAVVGPIAYIYLYRTCPKEDSFDTRKELKRVLRGHHLSDEHPDKPKGYLAGMVARATATVTAESAVLTGYKLELTPYKGAFILAKLELPIKQMTVYWLGIAGEWRHIHTIQPPGEDTKKTD